MAVSREEIVANRAKIIEEDAELSKGDPINQRATSRPADPRAVETMERESDLRGRGVRRGNALAGRQNMLDNPTSAFPASALEVQQVRDERTVAAGEQASAAPGPQSERRAEASAATPPAPETTPTGEKQPATTEETPPATRPNPAPASPDKSPAGGSGQST